MPFVLSLLPFQHGPSKVMLLKLCLVGQHPWQLRLIQNIYVCQEKRCQSPLESSSQEEALQIYLFFLPTLHKGKGFVTFRTEEENENSKGSFGGKRSSLTQNKNNVNSMLVFTVQNGNGPCLCSQAFKVQTQGPF